MSLQDFNQVSVIMEPRQNISHGSVSECITFRGWGKATQADRMIHINKWRNVPDGHIIVLFSRGHARTTLPSRDWPTKSNFSLCKWAVMLKTSAPVERKTSFIEMVEYEHIISHSFPTVKLLHVNRRAMLPLRVFVKWVWATDFAVLY